MIPVIETGAEVAGRIAIREGTAIAVVAIIDKTTVVLTTRRDRHLNASLVSDRILLTAPEILA
ncbi:hypothetical protein N7492_000603 [Penicillium capsulatum]|uniref:Uncharacterized protein n=1 Tax=Penicillium capsulatum TaxID=69766 RepID=A0A9W9IS20_9EURO|nr:hypothetical protein N7492_000603 [Penicillium capsulatum]